MCRNMMTNAFNTHLHTVIHLWISFLVIVCAQSVTKAVSQESGTVTQELSRIKRSNLLYGHFGPGTYCNVHGKRISHGQVYATSKCLKSHCLMGTIYMYSEGCEDSDGQCHGVNSRWEKDCITYMCSKSTSGGYRYHYRTIVVDALCKDYFGRCHRPGQFFSFQLKSVIHSQCQCKVSRNMIYYRCL